MCERVGSPAGEALLEGFKPRPYTELVDGKTMAQVGAAAPWGRVCCARPSASGVTASPPRRGKP